MKTRYVCWWKGQEKDPGETPDASHVVEDWFVEGAAEAYAEKCYDAMGEHVDEMTIMVRDGLGVVYEVVVSVEFSPTFLGGIKEGGQ